MASMTDPESQGTPKHPDIRRAVRSSVTRILPGSIFREMRLYRSFSRAERLLYLRIRLGNALMMAKPRLAPITARSFLFVCFGNIMRSPMCEALMNRAATRYAREAIRVTSAGLNATPGKEAHPWAVTAAREFRISLENHRARRLTLAMVDEADAIMAMDYQNQVQLISRFPQAVDKIFMLSEYAGEDYHLGEIADPYYLGQEGTRKCYRTLDRCISNLVVRTFGD